MKGFYNVLETIKTELLGSPFCNTVTYGDIRDVDLAKENSIPIITLYCRFCTVWREHNYIFN